MVCVSIILVGNFIYPASTKIPPALRGRRRGFFVTAGVVEELDSHIYRSDACSRMVGSWDGRYPFLFEAFLQAGRDPNEFSSWSEIFRGPHRPIDDIIEFLHEKFSIVHRDLESQELEAASD